MSTTTRPSQSYARMLSGLSMAHPFANFHRLALLDLVFMLYIVRPRRDCMNGMATRSIVWYNTTIRDYRINNNRFTGDGNR